MIFESTSTDYLGEKSRYILNIMMFTCNSHEIFILCYRSQSGRGEACEYHIRIPSNFSLFVANEEDWHIAGIAGRVKFHLIKRIRSSLTRNVLLDDSGGGGIRE